MAANKRYATKKGGDVAPIADEAPVMEQPIDMSARTVNGKPIPAGFEFAIPYENTDQGIAEANAKKAASGLLASARVEVGGEKFEKDNQAWEAWDGPDPIKEAIERVGDRPDRSYRLLSPKKIERAGFRGWNPSEDSKGQRVTLGGMILAEMPKARAEKRNAHYRELGNEALRTVAEANIETLNKTIRDAGERGKSFSALRAGDQVQDHDNPDVMAPIGVVSRTGRS